MRRWLSSRAVRISCVVVVCAGAQFLVGCTAIGGGHSTIILGDVPPGEAAYPGTEFQGLLHSEGEPAVVPGRGTVQSESLRWKRYSAAHRWGLQSAQLDLTIRDLDISPPLDPINIESTNAADIAKIMSDSSTTPDQKGQLVERLRNNYRRMPENYLPMVPRQEFKIFSPSRGMEQVTAYHYFPKVELSFTGQLESVASLDRFDFLAAAVTIEESGSAPDQVTFANFTPKVADLFDFSLGALKETGSATAAAQVGGSAATKATASETPKTGSTSGSEIDTGATNGASLSMSLSDELTRDLKSSLDARSAGILNGGRTFIIQLRSNDQHRIAGTYAYSVMLDIPPDVKRIQPKPDGHSYIVSDPITHAVWADVRLIAVIRHVAEVGKTGTFKRVPEPTNDETFQQVVVQQKRVLLWQLHEDVLVDSEPTKKPVSLIVYTNQDNASFSVFSDDGSHRLLERGKGRETSLSLPDVHQVDIEYDPIILTGNSATVLRAPAAIHVHLDTASAPMKLVGDYLPEPKKERAHGKK